MAGSIVMRSLITYGIILRHPEIRATRITGTESMVSNSGLQARASGSKIPVAERVSFWLPKPYGFGYEFSLRGARRGGHDG